MIDYAPWKSKKMCHDFHQTALKYAKMNLSTADGALLQNSFIHLLSFVPIFAVIS